MKKALIVFTVLLLALFSCKEKCIVEPPPIEEKDTVLSVLSYFPLNIGDIKYYNRQANKEWAYIENSQFKTIIVNDTTLENGLIYSKYKEMFFYSDSTQNTVGESYYRIDTSSHVIYSYIRHKNREEVFLPLNLKVNENFSINEEENITLTIEDTITTFGEKVGRKVFERADIYGYTYSRYELLENIGLFNYLYRGDIIGSTEDSLRGAIINGEIIGDISEPSFPKDSTMTRCDSLHNEYPNYIFVPCGYNSIQSAIDGAYHGDIIIVENGYYREEIDFKGKEITLASLFYIDNDTTHISNTVIAGPDGVTDEYIVKIVNAEDENTILTGFTIDGSREGEWYYGGGIKCINSSPTLISLIVSNNSIESNNGGGGIYLDNSKARIISSKIKSNHNYRGAGIYAVNSSPVLDSIDFTNNRGEEGGGLYLSNSDAKISNCTFTGNHSDYDGGGIYCNESDPIIENSEFISNSSTNGSPAIYFKNSTPRIIDIDISNSSGDFEGQTDKYSIGAISSNIIAEKISIIKNKSSGIYLNASKLTLTNSVISNNIVGIYATYNSLVELTNVSIFNNRGYRGSSGMILSKSEFTIDSLKCIDNGPSDGGIGGIGIFESTGSIQNSIVSENSCSGHGEGGGGFYISNSTVSLSFVLISDNSSNSLFGPAIYADSADIEMTNVTLTNHSEHSGSIYNINNSKINIVNAILWNNNPLLFYDTLGVKTTYSDVEGGYAGDGNINKDPLFCSPAEKKYTLQQTSPCINIGENGVTIGSEDVGCN